MITVEIRDIFNYNWNTLLFWKPNLDSIRNWVWKLQTNRWDKKFRKVGIKRINQITIDFTKHLFWEQKNFCKRKCDLIRNLCKKEIVRIFWNYFTHWFQKTLKTPKTCLRTTFSIEGLVINNPIIRIYY